MMIGFVTGVSREAACLKGFPIPFAVACSGADAVRAEAGARRLVSEGVTALVSFGLAGGLVDGLAPGDLFVPERIVTDDGTVYRADPAWRKAVAAMPVIPGCGGRRAFVLKGALVSVAVAVDTADGKRSLAKQTRAVAVDMESAAVARVAAEFGLPFLAFRAVGDPVVRPLPSAALAAVGADGSLRLGALLLNLAGHPFQVVDLVRLSLDSAAGLATLKATVRRLKPPPAR
jgi:adenosylhomocysteine nucleosidase